MDYEIGETNDNIEVMSTGATIHSAEEDAADLIYITDKPINLYKNQIYLQRGGTKRLTLKIIHKKCQNHVIINDTSDLLEIMKKLIVDKGIICVYCDDKELFLNFQNLYKNYYASNKNLTISRSSKKLVDVTDKNKLYDIIKQEHLRNNHRGINEVFQELRERYFYPNLIVEISKIINICEICNLAKHDRGPHKISI